MKLSELRLDPTWPQQSHVSWPIGLSNEEIYFDLIQFINDSVGMSIATSAIAFYIPVGIMCTLYSQVIRDPLPIEVRTVSPLFVRSGPLVLNSGRKYYH